MRKAKDSESQDTRERLDGFEASENVQTENE